MRTGTGAAAGRWGAAPALFGVGLLLASVAAGAGAAQPADPSSPTAQDLKAAIEEANHRVEQQRQAAGDAPATEAGTSAQELRAAIDEVRRRVEQQRQATPAGDPAEELRAARGRVEGLARAMLDLRTERDALRAQLSQTRDGLAEAQQRQAAGERDRQAAAARAADLEKELAAATDRAGEADGLRAHAGELTAALAAARAETEGLIPPSA